MSDITLKDVITEDFVNYKLPSMTLLFPHCDFKCDRKAGKIVCQNHELAKQPNIKVDVFKLVDSYVKNPITKSIVCQGLEPLLSITDLLLLIITLRNKFQCNDPVIIYTGYSKEESKIYLNNSLGDYSNIIIKYGHFIDGHEPHYDSVLGVYLASDNQYAEILNNENNTE